MRFQHTLGPGRVSGKPLRQTAGARGEGSAAIGTDAFEDAIGATGAERAFEAADPGFGGVRRQIPVATFAIGPELKQLLSPCAGSPGRGLDPFHIPVGQAEMMADFMYEHMCNNGLKRLVVFGPIIQDRPSVEPDPVG